MLTSSDWEEIYRLNPNPLRPINKRIIMKFINYLEKVSGVDFMGLLSLTIFFLFFTGMLIWVFRTRKEDFKEVSQMPLDHSN